MAGSKKPKSDSKLRRQVGGGRFNKKVFWLSVLALLCLVLGFVSHWIFIVPAVIFIIINQKALFKN